MPKEIKKPPRLIADDVAVAHFMAIHSGQYDNFGITPCYVNGEASMAIVAVHNTPEGHMIVTPLFVAPTATMVIADEFGNPTQTMFDTDAAKEAKAKLDEIIGGGKN